jgi:hypothetical protein
MFRASASPHPVSVSVDIENLSAFRRELRAADSGLPRQLSAAMRKAGVPPIDRVRQLVPTKTGTLKRGYKVSTSGSAANIINKVPYSGGAEWGRFGKWEGFMRYGDIGRFAWRAVEERADEIEQTMYEELRALIELGGFARDY